MLTVDKYNHMALSTELFEQLVDRVDSYYSNNLIKGFSSGNFSKRIVQLFVASCYRTYISQKTTEFCSQGTISAPSAEITLGEYRVDIHGRVSISKKLLCKNYSRFLIYILRDSFSCIFTKTKTSHRTDTFLSAPGKESIIGPDKTDRQFLEFLFKGPVTGLRESERIIVEAAGYKELGKPGRVEYAKSALVHCVQSRMKDFSDVTALIKWQCHAFREYTLLCFRNSFYSGLLFDYSDWGMASWANERGAIKDVFLHIGSYTSQLLWQTDLPGRKFKLHMIWYAMNTFGYVYKENPHPWVEPAFKWMRFDEHWCWTTMQANWVELLSPATKTHVVGPILWYLPVAANPRRPGKKRLLAFDVVPASKKWNDNIGNLNNYYCGTQAIKFVSDILAVCEEISSKSDTHIEVFLKHKRSHSVNHDSSYLEYIDKVTQAQGRLLLLEDNANLYEEIPNSDLVVSSPFSSTTYLSASLGVPGAYYDSMDSLQEPVMEIDGMRFLAGRDQLTQYIEQSLG